MQEPGGLQSIGQQRVGHDRVTEHACVYPTALLNVTRTAVLPMPSTVPGLGGNKEETQKYMSYHVEK